MTADGVAAHGKRVAHWASIKISRPHSDSVFLVKSDSPRIAEAAAGSGLYRHALLERKRRIKAELFCLASLSHKTSVMIAVASGEAMHVIC